MSIFLMNAAWRLSMPATKKMVLLAMCDWANDEGSSCRPSMRALAQKASISERQVKRVVHDLIDEGWAMVVGNEFGGAPGQTRQYQLNVKAIETGDMGVTGDNSSRVTNEAGQRVTSATGRVTSTTETGDMGVTQSTIDPPVKASTKRATTNPRVNALEIALPIWLDRESWARWVEHRRSIRKEIKTEYACELQLKALGQFRNEGHLPKDVIDNAIANGWQGLYAPKSGRHTVTAAAPTNNRQKQLEERNRQVADAWVNGSPASRTPL